MPNGLKQHPEGSTDVTQTPRQEKREQEVSESEAITFHQLLGIEIDRDGLTRIAEGAQDVRAQVVASTVLEAADAGTLSDLQLDPEAVALLRDEIETGGEPTEEVAEDLMDEIETPPLIGIGPMARAAEEHHFYLSGPMTEGTAQRIAFALEAIASQARPDLFGDSE